MLWFALVKAGTLARSSGGDSCFPFALLLPTGFLIGEAELAVLWMPRRDAGHPLTSVNSSIVFPCTPPPQSGS